MSNPVPTFDAPAGPAGFWGTPTSTIDWCEGNYEVTYYIAEFWNSISNISFLLPPLVVAYLLRSRLDKVFLSSLIYLAFTGCGSFAFHSTLRFDMQLWDEMSMVWTALFVFYLILRILKPATCHRYIPFLIIYGIFTNTIYLTMKTPIIFQVFYGLIHVSMVVLSYFVASKVPCDRRLYWSMFVMHNVAFLVWNIDNHYCPWLSRLREQMHPACRPITQFHAVWHILAGYGAFLLVLYLIQAKLYLDGKGCFTVYPNILSGVTLKCVEEGKGNYAKVSNDANANRVIPSTGSKTKKAS